MHKEIGIESGNNFVKVNADIDITVDTPQKESIDKNRKSLSSNSETQNTNRRKEKIKEAEYFSCSDSDSGQDNVRLRMNPKHSTNTYMVLSESEDEDRETEKEITDAKLASPEATEVTDSSHLTEPMRDLETGDDTGRAELESPLKKTRKDDSTTDENDTAVHRSLDNQFSKVAEDLTNISQELTESTFMDIGDDNTHDYRLASLFSTEEISYMAEKWTKLLEPDGYLRSDPGLQTEIPASRE